MSRAGEESRLDEQRRELARTVRGWSIDQLHDQLRDAGVTHAFIVHENGEFQLSHPKILRPVQAFLELSHDFSRHEGVFIGREEGIRTLFFAFVHDTRRGLAQGGLRFWHYDSVADLLTDGLRLCQGMTRKNALAGLWWGGGKGIVALPSAYKLPGEIPERSPERLAIFEAYGRFIASLGGVYYTAEDVGTKTSDMDAILSRNRFVTCISPGVGGSGNPSPHTARGVFRALQAAWLFLERTERLEGVRVAVQGAGNVGVPLIDQLDEAGAEVWVSDVSEESLERLRLRRPRVHTLPVAEADRIFDLDVDVFAPCARGAVVNERTIPRLKARLVCGAANNILETPEDADRLRERGIAFVPDYVCNRMGIMNCADEWQGYLEEDVRLAAERVFPDTLRVLRHANNLHVSSLRAADELADIAASELNPLLGHRGRRIVDHLIASGWHLSEEAKHRSVEPAFEPPLHEPEIRVAWEKDGLFRGKGPAVASMPVSTASRPNLASFLSPLLMDVRARFLESIGGEGGGRPRRIAGSDHGGLGLQLAVERSLPYERQEVGRPEVIQLCQDQHDRNDAAIRDQLHQLGAGYDPAGWLDPMDVSVAEAVRRLFYTLVDEGLVVEENRLAYRCPRCESVLVASDLQRAKVGDGMGWRCGRCESVVEPDSSPQLFIQLEGMAGHLRRAIENGAVTFSGERWTNSVLADLDGLDPWCISRQYWWGNEIPEHFKGRPEDEVLSSWFSLAAWTLRALGWPETATPEPIEDVFVDPAWLRRWVVPSQLLALHLTGRPAFRRVHVHGTVQIRDRNLLRREDAAPAESRDEELYLFRTALRPMRKDLGNVVEPATLIRRFGADALRLGFLLALDRGPVESVTLGEGELRRARRAVQSLVSKVTGLYGMVREPLRTGPPRDADRAIVERCAAAAAEARSALEEHRYTRAAETLVEAVEAFAAYANAAAERRHEEAHQGDQSDLGAVRAATFHALREMRPAFGPLCPYLFERLVRWTDERCPQSERFYGMREERVA
jgi:glutamate dehydrogenase/leucine dehydrogenase/ribosomal protein S27AE